MARARRFAAVVLVVAVVAGTVGCDRGSNAPVPTTIPTAAGDRICRMVSGESVRTIAGGAKPSVRNAHLGTEPGTGYLTTGVCELRAGDVYLKLNVNWRPSESDRSRARDDLSRLPSDETSRAFPAEQGIGFVTTTRASPGQIDGGLLRGQYQLGVVLAGVSDSRDRLADAQALLLQAAGALALPVAASAPRPGVPAA